MIGQHRPLDSYDLAGALAAAEDFFWFFCADYLELVKDRAYGERGEGPAASARAALGLALSVVLRLFAPFLPFVTEEAWSWWAEGSVHRAAWPEPAEALTAGGATEGGDGSLHSASGAIAAIRGAKSGARVSMRPSGNWARRDHRTLMAVLPDIRRGRSSSRAAVLRPARTGLPGHALTRPRPSRLTPVTARPLAGSLRGQGTPGRATRGGPLAGRITGRITLPTSRR